VAYHAEPFRNPRSNRSERGPHQGPAPWAIGDRGLNVSTEVSTRTPRLSATVSFTLFVVTHVSIRNSDISSSPHGSAFADLQNAPLPRILRCTLSFGSWLEPRYIFGAGTLV